MSTVRVQVLDSDALRRAENLLAGIDGGVHTAVRNAISRAADAVRTGSVKAIRERYAISAANLRAEENVSVRYSYRDGVQAMVTFSGAKIPLYRYSGTTPARPTQDTGKLVSAKIGEQWRHVHPGVAASAHQLKGTAPRRFAQAFVAEMASGHTGIFERTGGVTRGGSDEIREIMGSSVPQMLGSQEVQEKLARDAMDKFEERLDHEVLRILNGWGCKT